MSKVIVFGVGQIAEVAYFYLTNDSEHDVVGFTVDKEFINNKEFHGLPVVDFEKIKDIYPPSEYKLFIPISYKGMNKIRANKYYEGKKLGYSYVSYISSKATYYNTKVGENCFIMENNVIQPYTEIGDNVIMWSGNHLGHHAKIQSHCFIASHVVISGAVNVGEYSFLGVNSTIRDSVHIGKESLIGAGSVIVKDTEEKSVYVPTRSIKLEKSSDMIRKI
ncbi:MAG: acetyltransferase [Clostridiales bacterium]|nr:acetyltransferase [Clostridiales bacterium]